MADLKKTEKFVYNWSNRLVVDFANALAVVNPPVAGPIGAQGPIGPTGATGPAGAIGPAGLTWKGTYSASGVYVLNDAVGYGGASYYNVLACTSCTGNPSTNATNWALLASIGATGPTGATGPQGPAGSGGETKAVVNVTPAANVSLTTTANKTIFDLGVIIGSAFPSITVTVSNLSSRSVGDELMLIARPLPSAGNDITIYFDSNSFYITSGSTNTLSSLNFSGTTQKRLAGVYIFDGQKFVNSAENY